jgi:DNA-binding SARP family transcriptional activator
LAIDSDLERVRLSVDPAAIDLHAFQHGIQLNDAKGWVAAAAAYHGDLLSGIEVSDELDEWLATPRRANHQQALALAERMSSSEGTGPEVVDAVEELAERLLMSSPAAEEAHRALIRARMQRGRTNTALRQFEQCREALRAELQAEPDAQTAALAPRLRSQASSSSSVTAAVSLPIGRAPTADPDRERPSVFVMPFDNLSGGADDYFVDGVVEEITSALSRVQDFFVIARQSVFTYKGRFVDVRHLRGRSGGVVIACVFRCNWSMLAVAHNSGPTDVKARAPRFSSSRTRLRRRSRAPCIRLFGARKSKRQDESRRVT